MMSSEDKPRKNPEDQKVDKQLTDEQLEEVSGGSESYLKSSDEQRQKSPTMVESDAKRVK